MATTLGPTSSRWTPANEEEWFAREDAEKKRRLALEERRRTSEEERERRRALHHMRCPKCGAELRAVPFRGVEADLCFDCGGMFLDRGEVERLSAPERAGVMEALLRFVR
jgi:uncharacterized protein